MQPLRVHKNDAYAERNMAEIVAVATGTAGIATLGCQVLEQVFKLQQTITSIRNAPHEIETLLEELATLTSILNQYSEHSFNTKTGPNYAMARERSLMDCQTAYKSLLALLSELDGGIRASRYRFCWHSVLTVVRSKKLSDLIARLERAKMSLVLAQLLWIPYNLSYLIDFRRLIVDRPATERSELSNSTICTSPMTNNNYNHYHETLIYLGIGVFVLRCKSPAGQMSFFNGEKTAFQLRFAEWFSRWALEIAIYREFGRFKIAITPQLLVPENSAIFQACATGDDQVLTQLIQEGKASPFDMTSGGVTPLHVAAAWLRPSICKLLLDYGADGSISLHYRTLAWSPLALAAERAGKYRCFVFPGLENYPLIPEEGLIRMRETLRMLTNNKDIEVSQGYDRDAAGVPTSTCSALHKFRGSSEDFLWLTKHESMFETSNDSDDYIASVVIQQTQMFPNDSFPAAFDHVTNLEHLANYKDSSGSTLLHYLLNTNFGTKPGFWLNGLNVFEYVAVLLKHVADPSARDYHGDNPLMQFARHNQRYYYSTDTRWTPESAQETFAEFLALWAQTLRDCHVNMKKYLLEEIEAGAGSYMPCEQYDYDGAPNESEHWFVKLVFELDGLQRDLRIKLRFHCQEKDKMIPGSWPNQYIEK